MNMKYLFIILFVSFFIGLYYSTKSKDGDINFSGNDVNSSGVGQKERVKNPVMSGMARGIDVSDRYMDYLADDAFINNFPFQAGYATNEWKQTSHLDWPQYEQDLRNRHFFVYDFYRNESRFTKAFQIITEVLSKAGLPKDPYAHGIIFNKLNEAAVIRKFYAQHPDSEKFQKLMKRAESMEQTLAMSLRNEDLWYDGVLLDPIQAQNLADELLESIDYTSMFGDFLHFGFRTGGKGDPDLGKRFLVK